MSWGSAYGYESQPQDYSSDIYGSGSSAGGYPGAGSLGKRSHSPDNDQLFKKPKSYGGPSSWEDVGGNGFTDFDSGPTSWDQLKQADSGPSSWDDLSGPTSWDQISSTPKPSTPSGGRGAGRGDAGRGSRGRGAGGRGAGNFGQGTSGNFGQAASRGGGGSRGGAQRGGGQAKGRGGGGQQFGGAVGGGYSGGGDDGWGSGGGSGYGGDSGFGRGRGGGGRGGGFGGSRGGGFGRESGGWGGERGQWGGGGGGGRGGPRGQKGGNPQRGRGGRGGGGGAGLAVPGGYKLSLVDKFVKFGAYLRNEGATRVNSIQSIENGCTQTAMGLKTEYEEAGLPKIYNRSLFTGKLSISGIFLARSLGGNKKTLKHEVYNIALDILMNKSVAEINDLKDPGMQSIKGAIELYLKEDVQGETSLVGRMSMEEITEKLKTKMGTMNALQGGLQRLKDYLKKTPNLPSNSISQIEQAVQASKCCLPHSFDCTEERDVAGGRKYRGAFMIGDLCIARAEGESMKKQCKQETYNRALDALLNKTLSDLLVSVQDPSGEEEAAMQAEETVVSTLAEKLDESNIVKNKPQIKEAPIEIRLREFMKVLLTTAFQEDNIHNMDNLASHYHLTIMCLYRKSSPESHVVSSCELYIENYLIAKGTGPTKKECLVEAYSRSWEVLTTSSVEDIVNQHKKIAPEETAGPSVLEVFMKGATGVQRESNLYSLRRYGLDPYDKTKKASDMVIVECADWHTNRRFNAFCIMQYSATANGMLLQWSSTPVQNPNKPNYRFERRMGDRLKLSMYLQSELIGEASGPGKNKVRNQAAAEALFEMYETHDVIRVVRMNDEDRWIPFEQIEDECNKLRKQAGQPPRQQTVFEGWEAQIDEYLVTTLKAHISKFFPREDAEELLFGVGIPEAEIRVITAYARSLKICCDTRQFNEEPYLVLYVRQDMQKLVQLLKAQNGKQCGKYILVPRTDLPSSEDLQGKGKKL